MVQNPQTFTPVFNTVSCAADGLDLRPALDALEREIERRQPTPEKPLFVMMGESHNAPAHILLQQGLMARLLSGVSPLAFAYGLEQPHTELEKYISDVYIIPPALRGRISEADHHGQHLARSVMERYRYIYAPKSNKNLLRFCFENSISVSANDVSERDSSVGIILDQNDAKVRELVHKHAPDLTGKQIDPCSPEGMALRNRMIVEQALAHAQKAGASIYIQQCGRDHVLGSEHKGEKAEPYADSLSACFIGAGADVLPVHITSKSFGPALLPSDAIEVLQNQGLVIDGLNDRRFVEFSRGEEAMIKKIAKHSGEDIKAYPERGWLQCWRDGRSLERDMAVWIQEARLSAPAMVLRNV